MIYPFKEAFVILKCVQQSKRFVCKKKKVGSS
eukprot:UN01906